MPVPQITVVALTKPVSPPRPLVVLGPSLGTSVATLWSEVAGVLGSTYDVIGWDLPGHGRSRPTAEPFTVAELAAGVLAAIDVVQHERGDTATPFAYAGDSIGGAVGLQLALDAPDRVAAIGVVCSSARFGDEQSWRERVETVRQSGTASLVGVTAGRWFAPGFLERRPEAGSALLHTLRDADDGSYARAAEALAVFDLRARLPEISTPTLVISGALDVAAPPADGRLVATAVRAGRYVELPGVGHQAPVEAPEEAAALLADFFATTARRQLESGTATEQLGPQSTRHEVYDAGLAVRRQVLGSSYVDRTLAATDDTTRDFQELITRYAWGSVWTRPGLTRRERSMVTLTALVAHGHWEELALHVRAAVTNGLSRNEIAEVLMQSAIYCGVPAANAAFRVAREVFVQLDEGPEREEREESGESDEVRR